jgi:hypothetical protein
MASPETAKDAHRGNGDVFLNSEQFCRPLDTVNNLNFPERQAVWLSRRFAISLSIAMVLAATNYDGGES